MDRLSKTVLSLVLSGEQCIKAIEIGIPIICFTDGLLAQYVQKAGRLPFGYPTGLLAKIAHTFLSQVILNLKLNIKQKNKHGQQSISAIRAQFFMRIRYRFHTVYRIFFLTISTPM